MEGKWPDGRESGSIKQSSKGWICEDTRFLKTLRLSDIYILSQGYQENVYAMAFIFIYYFNNLGLTKLENFKKMYILLLDLQCTPLGYFTICKLTRSWCVLVVLLCHHRLMQHKLIVFAEAKRGTPIVTSKQNIILIMNAIISNEMKIKQY